MNTDPLEFVDPGTAISLAGAVYLLLAIAASLHVILNKRNEAAAFSWLGIIVLAPLVGAVLYWLFGINRIRRRAQAELPDPERYAIQTQDANAACLASLSELWCERIRFGAGVHSAPYLADNELLPLINGDQSYPEMLAAIDAAKHSVVLCSYIFEYDEVGRQFVNALVNAHRRGVLVRVLIDGLGVGYGLSLVRADRVLRRQGVKTARFLATLSTRGTRFINLRNHRKILSVDGRVAFVGGMNIRQGNILAGHSQHKTQDVHFRVCGPVIDQINTVFVADWAFSTKEQLHLPTWQAANSQASAESNSTPASTVISRVILDGPDDNYQKLQLTILGALHAAKNRVCVVSPYFLPDKAIMSALQMAVLRGVKIDVIVPAKNNLHIVGWAMKANLGELAAIGVDVYESSEPFDHSKLFVVDDYWCLVGSSNWDARSLELNFEINLECFDTVFNQELLTIVEEKLTQSIPVSQRRSHHFLIKLRNNFFRLFSPYL